MTVKYTNKGGGGWLVGGLRGCEDDLWIRGAAVGAKWVPVSRLQWTLPTCKHFGQPSLANLRDLLQHVHAVLAHELGSGQQELKLPALNLDFVLNHLHLFHVWRTGPGPPDPGHHALRSERAKYHQKTNSFT